MAEATVSVTVRRGVGPALDPHSGDLIEVEKVGTFATSGDTMTFPEIDASSGAIKTCHVQGLAAQPTVVSITNNVVTVTVTGGTVCHVRVVGKPAVV